MSKPTRAILWCVVFVVLAELVLRAWDPGRRVQSSLTTERPLAFILGTSRSLRGLRPSVIEEVLRDEGLREPWVGNASQKQVTTVGLYRRYRNDLAPLFATERGHGLLAIEVRASGMNDNYLVPDEQAWVDSEVLPPMPGLDPNAPPLPQRAVGAIELLRAGRIEAAAIAAFGSLALTHTRETLRPAIERVFGHGIEGQSEVDLMAGSPPASSAPETIAIDADWARGEKGWEPFPELVAPGLKRSQWEPVYRNQLLKNYHLGGIQTEFLRRLVRESRLAGLTPVLFVMPITDIQKSFFKPGEFESFLTFLERFAQEERVVWTNLDAELDLPIEAFYDTHHINSSAVPKVSREFARRVLVPGIR
jgi:hypothetical protein